MHHVLLLLTYVDVATHCMYSSPFKSFLGQFARTNPSLLRPELSLGVRSIGILARDSD